MDYLPITVQMKGRLCLIVGGGEVATRKLKHLLKAQSNVLMVSDNFSHEIEEIASDSGVRLVKQQFNSDLFETDLLNDVYLVIAATNDPEINRTVSELAKSNNLWVNVVDNLELSTFIMPAVIDRSPLLVAVSSSGVSPVLSRIIREKIEWLLPASLGKLLQKLKLIRPEIKKKFSNIKGRRGFSEWFIEAALKDDSQLGKETVAWFDDYKKNNPEKGKVFLVGAGPGSADLITVKGLKLIQKADVVLYDALVSDEILASVRKDAKLINVGKRAGSHPIKQEKINQLLVEYANQGLSVIRLKGGDPFIFGRGGEELQYLLQKGIEFEVVPGITAATGCASYAGIPLTHRDYSQSVKFVTAHEKSSENRVDWRGMATENQTLVFYMGLMRNEQIASSLIRNGLKPETPVAIIEQGTSARQRVIIAQLHELPLVVIKYKIMAPALIIVGEVARMGTQLNWFKSSELINAESCIEQFAGLSY